METDSLLRSILLSPTIAAYRPLPRWQHASEPSQVVAHRMSAKTMTASSSGSASSAWRRSSIMSDPLVVSACGREPDLSEAPEEAPSRIVSPKNRFSTTPEVL